MVAATSTLLHKELGPTAMSCVIAIAAAVMAMACGAGPSGTVNTPGREQRTSFASFAKTFRDNYPLHAQGIAVSDRDADGSRLILVAEPPPNVAIDDLKTVSPAFADAQVVRHSLGRDGWTTDILARLPPGTDIASLSREIHRLLFGTSYGAFLLPIPAPPHDWQFVEPDVALPNIYAWLNDPSQRAIGAVDQREVKLVSLLAADGAGVYFSDPSGLVLWVLPRGRIDEYAREFRIFALESDAIVGAVGAETAVVFVGRRRVLPVVQYPPLRFESLRALASAGNFELAQSFERNSIEAGHSAEGDWARIYLSPAILDTEVGSVLNIADQLLKSWSSHGTTTYENFSYPAPDPFPFKTSVGDILGAPTLRYNWNTNGFSSVLSVDGEQLLAFHRFGALPLTYFPEANDEGDEDHYEEDATPDADQASDAARSHFAAMGDPYLIRAAEYAALYTVLSQFDFQSHDSNDPAAKRTEEITKKHVLTALQRFSNATDGRLAKTARTIVAEEVAAGVEKPESESDVLPFLRDRRAEMHALSNQEVDDLAMRVATGAPDMDLVQRLATLFLDKKKLRDELLREQRGRPVSWIRTPDVVVSHNSARNLVGGHNIRAMPEEIATSDAVPRGNVRFSDSGTLLVNRDDLVNAARRAKEPITKALFPQTPPPTALPTAWGPVRHVAQETPTQIAITRGPNEYTVSLRADSGAVTDTTSVATYADALDLFEAHVGRPKATVRRLRLEGFDPDSAENFLRSADIRETAAGRVQLVKEGRTVDASKLSADYQLDTAQLKGVHFDEVRGGTELTLDFEVAARIQARPSLTIRIKQWFRGVAREVIGRLSEPIRSSVEAVLGRWTHQPTTVDALAREIRASMRDVTKRRPTLRIEIRSETGDAVLVELERLLPAEHDAWVTVG